MTTTTSAPATRFTYSTVMAQDIRNQNIIEDRNGDLAKVINLMSGNGSIMFVVTYLRDGITRDITYLREQDVFLMVPVVS